MDRVAEILPLDELRAFCQRWKIVRLEVFGSILRDDFTPESDVDFLVTWLPDADIGFFDLIRAEEELSRIVGRPVDLITRRAVEQSANWLRREAILSRTRELYAA